MAVVKLTEAKIRALPMGSGIHRDTEVKGLMVICHKTTKSYACQGDVRRNGRHVRTVRVKIDRTDRIGLAEARRRAKAIMSTIQSGVDPTAKPEETGITLEKAVEAHITERELSPATVKNYNYHVSQYLARFRKRAVADISRGDCRDLFETLERKHGRTTAPEVTEKAGDRPKLTVGTTVKRFLTETDLRYAEIVDKVLEEHPDARTTARSVASVASTLRKSGLVVPMRRNKKG